MENYTDKIAIVILNYNGVEHLKTFLPSVIQFSKGHRIIIADNCSTDHSIEYIQNNYQNIEIIRNHQNGGFAQGYNDALTQIKAEYYVLLNSDVEVSPNWLAPLEKLMDSDEKIAGCQPIIKSYLNKSLFEHAGAAGGYLDVDYYPFCRGRIFEKTERDENQYNTTTEVFWATGACMMIRSNLYHKVGGFDQTFFAHMEEIDLCWRLKRLGYKFFSVADSNVYHLGGGTLNYMSPKKTFLNFRNSLFMITKNYDGFLPSKVLKRLSLDGLATLQFLLSGQFVHILSLLKAHFSYYRHLPEMLNKRKAFKREHKIQFNKVGLYKRSIIFDKFILKKNTFSQLNPRDFIKP